MTSWRVPRSRSALSVTRDTDFWVNKRRMEMRTQINFRSLAGMVLVARLVLSLGIALLTVTYSNAQNAVVDWNSIASTTIVTNAKEASVTSGVWFAYVHLAVYDAVNAIDHQHQPYVFTTQAPDGASKDAAAVAAAHRILANYFPAQQASLDTQFTSSLAGISDTATNIAAGVGIGEQAAQALIAA